MYSDTTTYRAYIENVHIYIIYDNIVQYNKRCGQGPRFKLRTGQKFESKFLSFISKLTERIVLSRINDYPISNSLLNPHQSSLTKRHSTKTLLTSMQNKLVSAISHQQIFCLCLLDIYAAFETFDNNINYYLRDCLPGLMFLARPSSGFNPISLLVFLPQNIESIILRCFARFSSWALPVQLTVIYTMMTYNYSFLSLQTACL